MEENKNIDETKLEESNISESDNKIEETITREINLDELYDGAVNNTVIIDPVTKNEVLLKTHKGRGKILLIVFLVVILLLLYLITNKIPLNHQKPNVKPVTTTTTTTAMVTKKGMLNCTYSSESSSEKQSAVFVADYENENITYSEFNYVVNLLSESSEIYDDLLKQYENFFVSNASTVGIEFNKEEKSFNFKAKTTYTDADFSKYTITEGQTLLYAIPTKEDTVDKVKEIYTNKGYSCVVNDRVVD